MLFRQCDLDIFSWRDKTRVPLPGHWVDPSDYFSHESIEEATLRDS